MAVKRQKLSDLNVKLAQWFSETPNIIHELYRSFHYLNIPSGRKRSTRATEAHVFSNTTQHTVHNDKILSTSISRTLRESNTNHKCHQHKQQGRNIRQKHAHDSALTWSLSTALYHNYAQVVTIARSICATHIHPSASPPHSKEVGEMNTLWATGYSKHCSTNGLMAVCRM